MQISDAEQAPAVGATPQDEVRGADPADRAAPAEKKEGRDRTRSGRAFRGALERGHRVSAGAAGTPEASSAAVMAGWFRAEPLAPLPAATASARTTDVAPLAGARGIDRVLIGSGPDGAQARIRIGAGALAGTEIHLSAAAGGNAVEARLLTHTASSRETLSVVMDEIRSRLRERGIALATRSSAARPSARADVDEALLGDGGPAPPGATGGTAR